MEEFTAAGMSKRVIKYHLLWALALAFVSQSVSAVEPVFSQDGLAIGGYDPVTYFTERRPVWGNSKYSYQWQGANWHFDSKANRGLFVANPEKYAPQYGGYCAYAAAKNSVAPTDPNAWTVRDGKLYLNFSPAVKQRWLQNELGYISRADRAWPRIQAQQ